MVENQKEMIKRITYNLVLYWAFLTVIPFKQITNYEMKICFIIWVGLLFNIALMGRKKVKHLTIISAFTFLPFGVAVVINNLVGGFDNLYNYQADIWCECDRAYHSHYFGYWYMGISLPIYILWRIIDQRREKFYPGTNQTYFT